MTACFRSKRATGRRDSVSTGRKAMWDKLGAALRFKSWGKGLLLYTEWLGKAFLMNDI